MRTFLAILALLSAAPAHAVTPFFTQPFDPATTVSQEAADLDGDGRADIVHFTPFGVVEVRMGGPGRTFTAKPPVSFLSPVDRVRVGDFDGDGDRDLAGLRHAAVELLVDAGGGVLGNASTLPLPADYYARNLATGDLDGDGRDDLVVVANVTDSDGEVLIVWRATAGGFAPPVMQATERLVDDQRQDLVVANVGGDASLDVVSAGGGNGIAVHLGNGDGTLQATLLLAGVTYVNDVEVSDVDGDGNADLVVAIDAGTQTLRRYPGNGDGTFGAAQVLWTGFSVTAVAVGDVDGGGDVDVVFSGYDTGASLLRGEDGFAPGQVRRLINANPGRPARVADMDGDGKLDVFIGNTHGIYWGDADGSPGSWIRSGELSAAVQSIAVLDVSGDAVPDLVSTTATSAAAVERGHGDGTFELPVNFGSPTVTPTRFGDVNGDGNVDAISLGTVASQYTIQVLFGTGTPACFSGSQSTPTGVFAGGFAAVGGLAVADVNLDGKADVVYAGNHGGLTGPGPSFVKCYLGVAAGPLTLASDAAVALSQPVLADMDGDHVADLVGISGTLTALEVRHGNGAGSFGTPSTVAHPPRIYSFTVGNIDAGSALDCVIVGLDWLPVVALGNGDGTLQAPVPVAGAAPCDVASLADLDGDGDTDAVFSGSPTGDPNLMEVRLGDGTGALPESFMVSTGATGFAPVAVADLNSDARPDLVHMGGSFSFNASALHFNLLPSLIGVPPDPLPSMGIALSSPSPQGISRGLAVRFTLPDAQPARLEVFNVAGRRLARLGVGELGAGTHTATVSSAQTPGIVFVRLTRGDEHVTQRIATTR